jgi:NAD(P)-dependent dehydrogenase (short-subunit alcohol dehydrogenase family)
MSTDPTSYLQTLFGLDGRVAVVTGGASGLGAAFSKGLAAVGATVVIADINPETATEVVGEIEAAGGTAEFRSVDVTDVPAVNAFADGVVAAHGHVDVLINSAGAAHRSPIEDFAESAYDRILALNLKGTYFMSQAIGKKMLAQGKGSIINIASIGGFIAYPHSSAYLASKGGSFRRQVVLAEWNGESAGERDRTRPVRHPYCRARAGAARPPRHS